MAIDEQIFLHTTLHERFVAAATVNDETAAQRLQPFIRDDDLVHQRAEAWPLLSAGVQWAATTLRAAGVAVATVSRVTDSELAFDLGQYLGQRLFVLSELRDRPHDREALVVDAVKRACYAGADLGPIPGGRLAVPGTVVAEIAPDEAALAEVGSALGEALRRCSELGLVDLVGEATRALAESANGRA